MKIGFFDSGIGGLTVLYDTLKILPKAHLIYYADKANVPYGNRPEKEIKELTLKSCEFLIGKGLDLLVVACNTATSVAIKELRKKYDLPIVGMEPAVKPASQLSSNKRILVCATKYTLNAQKLHDLLSDLNAQDRVELLSLQKLVKFAEKKEWKSKRLDKYLRRKLSHIDPDKYSSVVLGCTHFIYYRTQIKEALSDNIQIIDGNLGTVNRIMSLLDTTHTPHKNKLTYYESGKKGKKKELQPYLKYLSRMEE